VPFAAGEKCRAFLLAKANVGLHAVPLLVADHRPDLDLLVARCTDLDCSNGGADPLMDRVEPALGHENTRARGTGLSAVAEARHQRLGMAVSRSALSSRIVGLLPPRRGAILALRQPERRQPWCERACCTQFRRIRRDERYRRHRPCPAVLASKSRRDRSPGEGGGAQRRLDSGLLDEKPRIKR